MKYRCPYCGEPAFTTAERIGLPADFGKFAAFFPTCPHCKRTATRTSSVGEWCRLSLSLILLTVITLPLLRWSIRAQVSYAGAVAVASLLLFVGGYFAIFYFLFHFDKSWSERRSDPRFTVVTSEKRRPPLRVGEIYVCRFPQRNSTEAIQIIGLIHRIKKQVNGYNIEMRIIRADHMELPVADEKIRIILDGSDDVEGAVTAAKT